MDVLRRTDLGKMHADVRVERGVLESDVIHRGDANLKVVA